LGECRLASAKRIPAKEQLMIGMGTMNKLIQRDYAELLGEIKQRIRSAQYEALKAVNKELISLYWDIGRMIVERQKGKTWGKSVVERLAKDLQEEFPGISGFSAQNLWRMKQFHEAYANHKKLSPLVREIGWTHNVIILMRCKDELEREFYIRMTRKFGWSKNVLIHQIENQTYEKTLLNQTNFDQTLPEAIRHQAKLAVKDEYTFDFLELADEYSERQLQQALLSKVEHFLREMGGVFAFVGSHYRMEIGDQEYFVDLLLYHRRLKCLVAIDMKNGGSSQSTLAKCSFIWRLWMIWCGWKMKSLPSG
jgi:predicted nuclease of restriction endonuclease-like (RecB) superfamily